MLEQGGFFLFKEVMSTVLARAVSSNIVNLRFQVLNQFLKLVRQSQIVQSAILISLAGTVVS